MQDYFNYFTEIEERFCQRRGTVMLCSTLDWALMETWKQAGIPLEAVLRGIDAAFDRYDARPNKTRKVNSLTYCAQEVLAAAEDIQEAGVGADHRAKPEAGLDHASIAAFFERNAADLELRLQADAAKNPQILARTGVSDSTGRAPRVARPRRRPPGDENHSSGRFGAASDRNGGEGFCRASDRHSR